MTTALFIIALGVGYIIGAALNNCDEEKNAEAQNDDKHDIL